MYNKLLRENTMVQFPNIIGVQHEVENIYRVMDRLRMEFVQVLKSLTGAQMYPELERRFSKALNKWSEDVNLSLFFDVRVALLGSGPKGGGWGWGWQVGVGKGGGRDLSVVA
jgi:hypothetical protein